MRRLDTRLSVRFACRGTSTFNALVLEHHSLVSTFKSEPLLGRLEGRAEDGAVEE